MKPRLSYKTDAIVLRTIDYGESDRIVTFYTADFGKLKGIAKGARRSQKRFANVLELFSSINILFSRRSYDGLALIEEGVLLDAYPQIRKDLNKTLFASYMIDVTDHFTVENKKGESLFSLLREFLGIMAAENASEDLVRVFEMRLLKLAGYEPVLDRCVACKSPVGEREHYHFSVREGGLKCEACASQGYDSLRLSMETIGALLAGRDMGRGELCSLCLSSRTAVESRIFMGRFIEHLLGREMKSLRVLREIREMGF